MEPHQSATYLSGDVWIQSILDKSRPLVSNKIERTIIQKLIEHIYHVTKTQSQRRLGLAAAFDLLVTVEYYRSVSHVGWFYCPRHEEAPLLLFPYTNVCPRCVLQNDFVFHKANKPKSGVIGEKNSRLLATFIQQLFIRNGHPVQVSKGAEPVDLVLIDKTRSPATVMFAEIKAAPLVTLPLASPSQLFTELQSDTKIISGHRATDHSALYGSDLGILLPVATDAKSEWEFTPFGHRKDADDDLWSYRSLLNLLETDITFLPKYIRFWMTALHSYEHKTQSDVFWLTNASGQPSPRPSHWPRRKGGAGYESISDSKSSVGMDRTDDLKKATYQVLKISAEGNPSSKFHYRAGVISNIHAVRHYIDYLGTIADLVWTRTLDTSVEYAGELPPDTPIFNLFDGIVTLTDVKSRDEWIREIFNF